MDCNGQARGEFSLDAIGRADESVESETGQLALEFPSGESWKQDGDVLVHSLTKKCFVQMVSVLVRDIEVCRVADPVHQVSRKLVISWKDEPRSKECRHEPWVTDDGPLIGFDQNACMPEGGRPHGCLGHRWIGELLATSGDMLSPLFAIPVAQLKPSGRIGVPRGRGST